MASEEEEEHVGEERDAPAHHPSAPADKVTIYGSDLGLVLVNSFLALTYYCCCRKLGTKLGYFFYCN